MHSLPRTIRWAGNVLIVTLFVGALALPMVSSLFGFAPAPSLQEKRRRAEAPVFKLRRAVLAEFPAKFEAYFNDNFPFRDQLVLWHNFVKVRALKTSPCPKVLIGKDGWLYYEEGLLDHDRAVAPLTEEQLAAWLRMLEGRRQWLAARGIRFVVVFAPDKQTVYPEYLPGWVKRVGLSPRLDQFLAYARAHSDLTIIDLREPLREAKKQEVVYFKTDTHWNYRGAFVGDGRIAEVLSQWYPNVQPLARATYFPASRRCVGDMTTMLGLPPFAAVQDEDQLLEARAPSPLRWEHNAAAGEGVPDHLSEGPPSDLPTAVLLHDSFGAALLPYFSQHFRRTAYSERGRDQFDPLLIEREKPDVVVCQFVERRLANDALPSNPAAVTGAAKQPGSP